MGLMKVYKEELNILRLVPVYCITPSQEEGEEKQGAKKQGVEEEEEGEAGSGWRRERRKSRERTSKR